MAANIPLHVFEDAFEAVKRVEGVMDMLRSVESKTGVPTTEEERQLTNRLTEAISQSLYRAYVNIPRVCKGIARLVDHVNETYRDVLSKCTMLKSNPVQFVTVSVEEIDDDDDSDIVKKRGSSIGVNNQSGVKRRLTFDDLLADNDFKANKRNSVASPKTPPKEGCTSRDFFIDRLHALPSADLIAFFRFFAATTYKRAITTKWVAEVLRKTEASNDQGCDIKDAMASLSAAQQKDLAKKLSSVWLRYVGVNAAKERLSLKV